MGRVVQGRAAGTKRARDVFRRQRLQPGRGTVELRALLVGLGRVELDADRGHGTVARWVPRQYIASSRWTCNRSDEHTSELKSIMRSSYAECCLRKKQYT